MTTNQPRLEFAKQLKLRMINEDITSAVCNSRQHCAIAQTIYRQMGQSFGRVRVTSNLVSIAGTDGFRYHYRVPLRAAQLVRDFDHGRRVKPITFILRYTDRRKIDQLDAATKQRVNKARRARNAALAAQGQRPSPQPRSRYGI